MQILLLNMKKASTQKDIVLRCAVGGLAGIGDGLQSSFLSFSSKKTPTSKVGDELRLLPN